MRHVKLHAKLHAVTDDSKHRCENCFKEFSRKYILTKHSRKCPPEETEAERRYQCGTCNKSFTHKFTLFDHERKKHHPTRLGFTCDICGSQFFKEDEHRKYLVHEHVEAAIKM